MMFQSTHPRRVRLNVRDLFALTNEFQSTHPRRVRQNEFKNSFAKIKFQSTHPRRVRRQATSAYGATEPGFNPRTHVGCDAAKAASLPIDLVSIHAPT